jgi:anti-sigma regulatory factor (Ser/Thr protein kinase)
MLELEFDSATTELSSMRDAVRSFLAANSIPEMDAELVVLALDEACANIIRHAYHGNPGCPIRLRCACRSGVLECVLRDYGESCDPAKIKGRALDDFRPGGLGIHIMERAFDQVEYRPMPQGTQLILTRNLQPESPPSRLKPQ